MSDYEKGSKVRRLAVSAFWLSGSKGLIGIFSFISTIILARILVPEDFGLIAIASVVLAVLDSVTELPVNKALIRLKSATVHHINTAFTISLGRGLLIASLIVASSGFLAEMYNEPRLKGILLVIACSSFLGAFANPKFFVFEKKLDYSYMVKVNVISRLICLILSITLAFTLRSYWALVISSAFFAPFRAILTYWYLPYRPSLSIKEWRNIFSFTGWLTMAGVINAIGLRLDTLVIGYYTNPTQLGSYHVGNEIAQRAINDTTAPLSAPLLPAFADIDDGDKSELRRVFLKSLQVIYMITLPIGFGLSALAPFLIPLLLGEKWVDAVFPVQVLAIVFAIQTVTGPANSIAEATGNTRAIFIRQLIYSTLRIPLFLIAIIYSGIFGLLITRFLLGTFFVLMCLNMTKRILGVSMTSQLLVGSRTYISIFSMTIILLGLQALPAFESWTYLLQCVVLVASGALTYTATHVLMWLAQKKPHGGEEIVIKFAGAIIEKILNKAKGAST